MLEEKMKDVMIHFIDHFSIFDANSSDEEHCIEGITVNEIVEAMTYKLTTAFDYEHEGRLNNQSYYLSGSSLRENEGVCICNDMISYQKGIFEIIGFQELCLFEDMSFFIIESHTASYKDGDTYHISTVRKIVNEVKDLDELEVDPEFIKAALVEMVLEYRKEIDLC